MCVCVYACVRVCVCVCVCERESGKEQGEEVCDAAREGEHDSGSAALALGTYRAEISLSIGSLQVLRSCNAPHLQHRALQLLGVTLSD